MIRTIDAATAARWINRLIEIQAALQLVDDLRPHVPHEVWDKVWSAKCWTRSLREQLLAHAITEVEIETTPAVVALEAA